MDDVRFKIHIADYCKNHSKILYIQMYAQQMVTLDDSQYNCNFYKFQLTLFINVVFIAHLYRINMPINIKYTFSNGKWFVIYIDS